MSNESNARKLSTVADQPLAMASLPTEGSTSAVVSNPVLDPSAELQPMETETDNEVTKAKKKKVRFAGVPEDTSAFSVKPLCPDSKQEQDLTKLLRKVQLRAARRRNRRKRIASPPPPTEMVASLLGISEESGAAAREDEDTAKLEARMKHMQRQMNYMEQEIHNAARMELALLNQSKTLREQRQKMTKRYEYASKKMAAMQHQHSGRNQPITLVDATRARINSTVVQYRPPSSLPPLFNASPTLRRGRRVSATEEETTALCKD